MKTTGVKATTRRTALAGIGVLAVGTLAFAALRRKPEPEIATLVAPGDAAPRLAAIGTIVPTNPATQPASVGFMDGDGRLQKLADFTGRALVVNLWATWCAPCVAELPSLATLARTMSGRGVLVLPISSDRGGAEVVRRFYDAHAITTLPVLLDPKSEAVQAWGVRGLPTTLLVDREGRERGRLEGAADWASDAMVGRLTALLG